MTTVLATAGVALALGGAVLNPWAHQLVDFDLGSGGNPSYPDASTALGPVDPVTGEGLGFPGPVTLFNPPFDTDEIVSLGNGGFLTIAFEQVVADQPGSDFIVFGNAGFFGADPTSSLKHRSANHLQSILCMALFLRLQGQCALAEDHI